MKKILSIYILLAFSLASSIPTAWASTYDGVPADSPSGAGSPFLGESFQTDLATGAATMSVDITVPPGRKNMQPKLALSYSSNNSNGVCGVGWSIPANSIQRSTKRGVPKYDNTDTFVFISSGANAELVDIGNGEYRAKIESAFMKYVFDEAANSWTVYDKSGTRYLFGGSASSRVENGGRVYGWYLDRVEDVYGNYITYIYGHAYGQIYLEEIQYTGGTGLQPDKQIVFTYSAGRADKMYSLRSGWEIITARLLNTIEVKLAGNTVWTYELVYEQSLDTGRNLLKTVTVKDKDGNALPPKTFTYQRLEE
jgi:hypothetical protein